jgi:hypothetical protein
LQCRCAGELKRKAISTRLCRRGGSITRIAVLCFCHSYRPSGIWVKAYTHSHLRSASHRHQGVRLLECLNNNKGCFSLSGKQTVSTAAMLTMKLMTVLKLVGRVGNQ